MAAWVPVIAALGAVVVSLMPWAVRWRRQQRVKAGQSGSVSTSEAGQLWKTTMDIIDRLQQDNDKLVAQRDRLIGLLDEKIAPALEDIATTQKRDGTIITAMMTLLEGGAHGGVVPAPAEKE